MTQDEKVAILKEARVWDVIGFPGCIDKLIDLVAAHEREACAKVCDDLSAHYWEKDFPVESINCEECAAAIRARGEK